MSKLKRTPSGEVLSNLIMDLFRLSSLLQTAGDRLVADLGLTSARWQILGTIAMAERPQPVAWLARDLRTHRQNIQRIVNDLVQEGFVVLETNPHHRRAQLVVLTEKGRHAYDTAMQLQIPWMNSLSDGLSEKNFLMMHNTIETLCEKLQDDLK